MEIKKIAVGELKEYENSLRNNEQAIDKIITSIKEFGFRVPIIIDEGYEIICGHARLKAAIKMGLTEVPCIIASDLTPDQIKAFRIVENKSAEWSDWNIELLNAELETIELDMTEFGFDFELPDSEPTEDDFEPILPIKPQTKVGDIYKLGEHILICGDSTERTVYEKLMNGQLARLIITDPPYNIDYEGKTKEKLKIQNDKMSDDDFMEFLNKSFANMNANLKNGGGFYIFHSDSLGEIFRKSVREQLGKIRQCIVWAKNQMVIGRQDYQWKHEPILYGWKEGAAHYFVDDRTQTTVIECKKPNRNAEHPTMKPIELLAVLIKNSSRAKDIILDPYGGSGSTLIACERLKRKCRIIELDPRYCDVIVQRYEKLTNDKAVLISGGKND
jgi:site-specific DNA-methyltransferase (adenine-specific)